jgi:zinc/manganese transport system permease protein
MVWETVPDLAAVLGMPFLACVAMTGILGYLGLHVLEREIVFVDIAMAQVVALGTIGAHLFFDAHDNSMLASASALGLAVVVAFFYAFTRRKVVQIPTEAVIGVSYAVAAAVALFLLGVAPGGHVHAQHMLAGSILWVSWTELLMSTLAFVGVGICFYLLGKPFARISSDYDAAVRDGIRVVAWDFLFYTLVGVVITFAVRVGGVVVVFCLLVIPATIAVMYARALFARLLIAWGAGVSGSFLGLLFADRLDFSVGPSVALLLGSGLAVTALWQRLRLASATAITVVTAVAYVTLLVTASPSTADRIEDSPTGETEIDAGFLADPATDPADLRAEATGPQARCDAVLRAIEKDLPSGLGLALAFLDDDPPLFFRQLVVDRLNDALDEPLDLDVTRPFADPANREATEVLNRFLEGGPTP